MLSEFLAYFVWGRLNAFFSTNQRISMKSTIPTGTYPKEAKWAYWKVGASSVRKNPVQMLATRQLAVS